MRAWLFLLFLSIASDMIASLVGAVALWRHQRRLALLFLAIFTEGLSVLVANAFGFNVRPDYTVGYAVSFWIGRGARSVGIWSFVLYVIGWRKESGD